jgi:hypothetical protein
MVTLTPTTATAVTAYHAAGGAGPAVSTSRRAPATTAATSVKTAMPAAAVSNIVTMADSRRGSL